MYIEASSVRAQSVKAVYGEFKIVDGDVSTKILYGEVYVTYKNPFQE